jgi:hypothetical protein
MGDQSAGSRRHQPWRLVVACALLTCLALPVSGCLPRGPSVSTVSPPSGTTGLAVDVVLVVRFDAALAAAPAGAVTVSPEPPGGITVELAADGHELRIGPAKAWLPAKTHTLTITRSIKDQSGRALRREHKATFATAAARAATCHGPAFSPQGDRIAWIEEAGGSWSAWVAAADASATPTRVAGDLWPGSEAVWLPDGSGLLVTAAVAGQGAAPPDPRLSRVSLETGLVLELPLNARLVDASQLRSVFSPDGTRLAVQNDQYMADAHSDYARQLGVARADGAGWRGFGNLLVGWASNDLLLWLDLPGIGEGHSFDYEWRSYDAVTCTTANLTRVPKFNNLKTAARSPDGRHFALASWAAEEVQSQDGIDIQRLPRDIWLLATDGLVLGRLTQDTGRNGNPVWTPRADLLLDSDRGGDWDVWLYRSPLDPPVPENLTARPGYDGQPAAAGELIAFISDASGNREVWVMRADGAGWRQLSR